MTRVRPQGKRKIIKYVRIYLDDIANILDIMKQNCESIRAYGDGYELENPSEIDEYKNLTKQQFYSLTIQAENPDVSFTVVPGSIFGGVGISIDKDDAKSVGIFTLLENILENRHNRVAEYIYSAKFFLIAVILVTTLVIVIDKYFKIPNFPTLEIIFWSLMILLLILVSQINDKKVRYINNYIHERSNFFKRNKDQIILIILGSLIGFLLTITYQYFKK